MTTLGGYADSERPVDAQSVDAIHDRIRIAILRGEIAPGDEVSQVRLARYLGVSRTPLREALRMLLHEGLLDGQPGRQMRVAGYSVQDMEQLYVERISLETMGIRLTVPRLRIADLSSLHDHHARMREAAEREDFEAWEIPHRALHETFVSESGKRMTVLIRQLSDHAARYRRLYTTHAAGAYIAGRAEHQSIIDACVARDPDAAARALAEHLGHTALGVIAIVEPDHSASRLRTAIAAASAASGVQ
ncbi:MAG: GntR family transcriptional regulator [Solirubrobacteraceae bacterium]